MNEDYWYIITGLIITAFLAHYLTINFLCVEEPDKPVGLIQLIEFHDIQGVRNWAYELEERGLKSLIYVQKNILEQYPSDFKWLASKGHEVAGGYAEIPFWDVNYTTQLNLMNQTKVLVENITGKPMRVFGSRYFAYDNTTLRVADELGVDYVLARGTADVEAVIYEPEEFNVKIISVSNVGFEDMGRGSLCDYSLWARGSTAEEFGQVIAESVNKEPERIMIVSHAYLGGLKESWWVPYQRLLDSNSIEWAASFDEWVKLENGVNIKVPNNLIPVNREVKYVNPQPSEPLEGLENVSEMHNPCAV